MLSISRIVSCVPCSIVIFRGCGGCSCGGAGGGTSAGGWFWILDCPGSEFWAIVLLLLAAELLFADSRRRRAASRPAGLFSVPLNGTGSAPAVSAGGGADIEFAEAFQPSPTCRLLTTSFTPSTDAAWRDAASRCASL